MQSLASTDGGGSRRRAADLIRRTRTYRAAHRREVPRLCALARKVESYHADDPAAPHGLAELLRQTWDELEDHMRRQERLIPSLLRQAAGSEERCAEMRRDLARHAARLRRVARLTRGFTPPEGACRSWWALYAMTFSFVDDLEEHMRLEAAALPRQCRGGRS